MQGYTPSAERYTTSGDWFRRCGRSGLMLPSISLGLWHNFGGPGTDSGRHGGEADFHANCRSMVLTAFDAGITHFDLANNYGPPPGAAEERFGRILHGELAAYRDELIISTKAGYRMWPGPYGDGGSRKYLLASLDQSLRRMGVDYVDIFYSHRPDADTPLEETLGALDQAVRSGKALYAGVSSYSGARSEEIVRMSHDLGLVRPVIHQPSYSMLRRAIESDLLPIHEKLGMGIIVFCPLAQGILTDRYLDTVPDDSRAKNPAGSLSEDRLKPELLGRVRRLSKIAAERGQTMAQMALSWVLRSPAVTSALTGASRPEQIAENVAAAGSTSFTEEELASIDSILA
jgi:L-glyceraldehyde 3-phosphate reductase